jgi:hypothetical protein
VVALSKRPGAARLVAASKPQVLVITTIFRKTEARAQARMPSMSAILQLTDVRDAEPDIGRDEKFIAPARSGRRREAADHR